MKKLYIDLLLLERNQSYGFQEYIFNILKYFYAHRQSLEFEEIVIACNDSVKDMFCGYSDSFTLQTFNCNSYLKRFWYQSILPFKLGIRKQDLLFVPGNYSGLFKKCKEVLVIHDLLFKRKEWLPNRLMRLQRNFYLPISIRKADKIVAISNFTKEDIELFYPRAKGKIEVIYNSMDFAKYNRSIPPQLSCDYFLAICSNAYHKNLKTVINAFKKYCENGGSFNLVFVGNINRTGEVARMIDSMPDDIKGRIIIKSQISNEELGGLYEKASCYVSASMFEGLGMPVVEAMSFNLPVLLSDIKPHREVSLNKGVYFEPTNVDELATKMLKVNSEKRNYRREVIEVFSETNTSAKYVEIINRVGRQ